MAEKHIGNITIHQYNDSNRNPSEYIAGATESGEDFYNRIQTILGLQMATPEMFQELYSVVAGPGFFLIQDNVTAEVLEKLKKAGVRFDKKEE